MSAETAFRSGCGLPIFLPMIIVFVASVVMIPAQPANRLLLLIALLAMETFFALIPFMLRYSFDEEKLAIPNPFAAPEPPVYYDSIWMVEDSESGLISCMHCASRDSIGIRYDRGTGHYVRISPRNKKEAMEILREKCPEAEFAEGPE